MATEEETFDQILNRATNPLNENDDWDSIKAYAQKINAGGDIQQTAIRLIAHKMQSPQERESLQALLVLEHCARTCDRRFHSEIGKFRFLNEMIKLVSPKYLGNRTPFRVKRRVIEVLYKWTHELRYETKIGEAYQMLKQQGVITEDPSYLDEVGKSSPPPRPRNAVFEDEEKSKLLQKLLQSKNAEDLQAANRLIKSMVKEDEKRMEKISRRVTELETVGNNVKVLGEMLISFRQGVSRSEEVELMKELYQSCVQLQPNLFRLATDMDEKDDGIADILKANDELSRVINQYKEFFGESTTNETVKNGVGNLSLLDLGSPVVDTNASQTIASSLVDDQLLALGLDDGVGKFSGIASKTKPPYSGVSKQKDLHDLKDLFLAEPPPPNLAGSLNLPPLADLGLLSSSLPPSTTMVRPLQPIPTVPLESFKPPAPPKNSGKMFKGFEDLDAIGQSLLRQSLPPTIEPGAEFPKITEKIPMNQMTKKSDSNPNSPALQRAVFDVENSSLSGINSPSSRSPAHEVSSLANVFVALESVLPGTSQPLTLYDKNGLTTVLHFATNEPRPDVKVMVVTTQSKNHNPTRSVLFQAAVPKSMKVKLQPPSATSLPPHNPILPPAAITQVMLLANPLREKVRLKYKIAYSLNEEMVTDVGEIDCKELT